MQLSLALMSPALTSATLSGYFSLDAKRRVATLLLKLLVHV